MYNFPFAVTITMHLILLNLCRSKRLLISLRKCLDYVMRMWKTVIYTVCLTCGWFKFPRVSLFSTCVLVIQTPSDNKYIIWRCRVCIKLLIVSYDIINLQYKLANQASPVLQLSIGQWSWKGQRSLTAISHKRFQTQLFI